MKIKKTTVEIFMALLLASLIVGGLLLNAYCNKYIEKQKMYNEQFNSEVLPKMGQE